MSLFFRSRKVLQKAYRLYSTKSYDFLNIENAGCGFSVLEMKKNPVNSLSLEMIQELTQAFDDLHQDVDCRGVIITSNLPVFSAGLDILEMYQPEIDRLKEFWISFQDLKLKLFSSPLITIAAINGPCPAGGCAIAFSCDYRVMANGKHLIGLNETLLGITAPFWLAESMKLLVGHREAERMLSLGIMCFPDEALNKGMVDLVVPKSELMDVCKAEMEKWLKIADVGRIATKQFIRKKFIDEFEERRNEDLTIFLNSIPQDAVQNLLGKYLENLKKKSR